MFCWVKLFLITIPTLSLEISNHFSTCRTGTRACSPKNILVSRFFSFMLFQLDDVLCDVTLKRIKFVVWTQLNWKGNCSFLFLAGKYVVLFDYLWKKFENINVSFENEESDERRYYIFYLLGLTFKAFNFKGKNTFELIFFSSWFCILM